MKPNYEKLSWQSLFVATENSNNWIISSVSHIDFQNRYNGKIHCHETWLCKVQVSIKTFFGFSWDSYPDVHCDQLFRAICDSFEASGKNWGKIPD